MILAIKLLGMSRDKETAEKARTVAVTCFSTGFRMTEKEITFQSNLK